ncbi:MAG TPA: cyclic nucleotide-binding domain-containing protein [Anaerolineales bacterium]|nr:cyclic nucleotide-binding domain-containing protein [Anaerolineales bacterium]
MTTGELGKLYQHGEYIVRQGEIGYCMYVIQEGTVEIILEEEGEEILLAKRKAGDFFGEMALFDRDVRSASVRALGPARILTVDKKNLLPRIHQDPSMAFRILEIMSNRIRELLLEVNRLTEITKQNNTH